MREAIRAIRVTLILWLLTALIYPLLILLVGQVFFPFQANGSLLKNQQGQVVGSALIGQSFSSDEYFISRPSAVNYSEGKDALPTGISGASNLAPSNPELVKRVQATAQQLQTANIQPTADLVYASASGLDPHISVASAYAQAPGVAAARSLSVDLVQALIPRYTNGRFLGIVGEPGVNVLQLNLALDNLKSPS
ncbi:K(+)-transporting ATPase subunit C [Trichocoleus sp. FACHB-90]|uniref:K(+)-transporting ATPase subunit C n=1 Tax=Cyanophyceae TaxID=3028117 RepID=UPI001686130B|nr:K(+)-transporting ATPase subunit C [Trichocoleus sp. FACHB-90]MBD1925265.1 K(+)-transporting ATPase subunit C [Trichocoleus sp. FACHB-90]